MLNGTLRAKRGGLLTDTVYVRERTATGDVLPNRFLWYFVLRSDRSSAPQDSVRTDAQGIARITGFFVGDSAGTAGITIFDRLVNLGCGFLQAEALISVSGPPEDLELVSGDFQTGVVGQDAASPIRVRVVDGGGRPISGQVVAWTSTFPSPAGGSVAGRFGTATTDLFGVASITFRLGVDLGVNRMTVTVAGAPSLVITAIGVP